MKIKKRYIFYLIFVFIIIGNCKKISHGKSRKKENPTKIITLAPALTEIVYLLDCGKSIIGNTVFCNYPPDAKTKQKVGGFLDINSEIILKLNPELIISYPEHRDKLRILGNRIEILTVKHISVSDILNSIKAIGKRIGKYKKANTIVESIKSGLYGKQRVKNAKRVLFIADRNSDSLRTMYIIGKRGFLNELLNLSGGINVYNGSIPYPSISIESVTAMNPDIIIELSFYKNENRKRSTLKLWNEYPMIKAVKNKKIYFLTEDFWQKPGPRIIEIATKLREIIN